jgi:predicted metalloprotease with PDZ domain
MNALTKRSPLALAPCAALLALALAAPAWAGGENCRKDAEHAKAHKTAHHDKAAKAEAIRQAGWSGFEAEKDAYGNYVVSRVDSGSPAAEAGVRVGDRLVAYQGIALTAENEKAIKAAKKERQIGARVSYTLARGDASRDVTLTLTEVPEAVIARWLSESEADQVAAAGGG